MESRSILAAVEWCTTCFPYRMQMKSWDEVTNHSTWKWNGMIPLENWWCSLSTITKLDRILNASCYRVNLLYFACGIVSADLLGNSNAVVCLVHVVVWSIRISRFLNIRNVKGGGSVVRTTMFHLFVLYWRFLTYIETAVRFTELHNFMLLSTNTGNSRAVIL